MNCLIVTKNVKEIDFEVIWGKLELKKKKIPEALFHKIIETNCSFHVK